MNKVKNLYPFLSDIEAFSDAVDGILADLPNKTVLEIGLELYEEEFAEGVPLIHSKGGDLIDISAAVTTYCALCVLAEDSSLPEKFRTLCGELCASVKNDKTFAENEIRAALEWKEEQSPLSRYLAWRAIAVQLENVCSKIPVWSAKAWHRGYCPICGMEPVSARLKKNARGTVRHLGCGACGAEWEYRRIGCPYCGTEDQEKLKILELENDESLRVDTCDECLSYIKTFIGDELTHSALHDIKTLHVDVLCGETKYKKHGGFFIAR